MKDLSKQHLSSIESADVLSAGPIIRIGPDTLDFGTATALTTIHRDRSANVKKADWYKTLDAPSGAFSIQTVIDKNEHTFRRRVLPPAFSESALRDQEKFIDQNVVIFLKKMGEDVQEDGWISPKDFMELITYFGFDFISDLAFGSRFKLLEEPEHRYLPDMLKWTNQFLYYAGYLSLAPLLRLIVGTSIMNYLPNQAALDTYKYFLMAERKLLDRQTAEETAKANGKEVRRDIFHYLFRSRDLVTGIELTKQQLQADAGLLIAAGSDGVSLTCAAAMFYLVRNPACLEKLTREIRSSFATLEDVRLPKLNQCTYLYAVVEEALRLAPCVASAFPREVLRGGLNVDGEHIPAGMTVGVSAYALHHNETYFPDSFAFKPERWLWDEASVAAAKSAFCTFGVGPYN